MPENIRIYNTLYEQYLELGLAHHLIDEHIDFTIFNLREAATIMPFALPVSRLNFFVFTFIKDAHGKYTVDDHTYSLGPNMIYLTNPGHYRSFEWQAIEEIYLITLGESFLKENVHPAVFEEFPFLLSETFPARAVSPAVFQEFEILYHQIEKEYKGQSRYRKRLIGNLFVVLLLKIKEYFWEDYNPIYEGNRSSQIVKNFRRQLEEHYRDIQNGKAERVFRIQDYADGQHLHPNYLGNVIKSKTGKAIGTWIMEKTLSEAKSMLQHTRMPVKEIAYRLGFNDTAHFSNYFSKNAGLSPASYRKAQNSQE
jgi:AraC family transcriptional regulator, transcriptional activator of pobA